MSRSSEVYVILITSVFLYFYYSGWDWEKKSPFWKCSSLWQMIQNIHQILVTISIYSVLIILLYFILRWENIHFVWILKKYIDLFDQSILRHDLSVSWFLKNISVFSLSATIISLTISSGFKLSSHLLVPKINKLFMWLDRVLLIMRLPNIL